MGGFYLLSSAALLGAQTIGAGPVGNPGVASVTMTGPPMTGTVLPTGTGAISGVVLDASTGAPIVGAVVGLTVASRASIGRDTREATDTKGRFVFTQLPAHDDYQLTAAMPGYFDGAYGQTSLRAGSSRIVLTQGEWFSTANISLWKGGSISGTVLDEQGDPIVGVYVHVLALVPVSGVMQLASGPAALTDDRGMYRIGGLGPGTYLVSVPTASATVPAAAPSVLGPATPFATFDADALSRLVIGRYPIPPPPDQGRRFAYPPAYAPDATSPARATPITLAVGESRTAIDIRLEPAPAVAITGRVDGLTDPISGLTLRLLPAGLENLGSGSETATALVGADGSFEFLNVPAGSYSIDLRRSLMEYSYNLGGAQRLPIPPGIRSWSINGNDVDSAPAGVSAETTTAGDDHEFWGHTSVTVGGADVSGVVVVLHHGSRISGRVTIEQTIKPPNPPPPVFVRARAEPASAMAASGGVVLDTSMRSDPLTFELTGIAPGQYVLRFSRPGASLIRSILIDGADYTYRPLDLTDGHDVTNVQVTFTDQVPTLTGTVHNPDEMVKSIAIIAFPVEPDQWTDYGLTTVRIKTTVVTGQGTFRMTSLPDGDYYVIAVPLTDRDGWQDPAFLKLAARSAARVSLKWGQEASTDLTLVHVR